MKVIILEDIKNFAKKHDVKEVKSGYARNFLFPKNLAKPATEEFLKELEIRRASHDKKEEEIKNKLQLLARDLEKKEFVFELKIGKKEEVFGSVSKEDIKNKLAIDGAEVKLEHPIKTIGDHKVEVDLSRGVKAKIKVIIKSASA